MVNVHHYDEPNDAPREQRPRFLGLWKQVAARYAGWPGRLYFAGTDFGAFDPERNTWREPLRDALLGDENRLAV